MDGSPVVLVLGDPAARHLRLLARLPAETVVRFAGDDARGREQAADAEVVVCDCLKGRELPALFPHMPHLRWVHSIAAPRKASPTPGRC